jgi:hypothetical protein
VLPLRTWSKLQLRPSSAATCFVATALTAWSVGCTDLPVGATGPNTWNGMPAPEAGVLGDKLGDASARGDVLSPRDSGLPSDAPGGPISEDEWERKTAPLRGAHDVEWRVSMGCPVERIAQDFRIVPTVGCYVRRDAPAVRDCDVEPFCTGHDECNAKPLGRCRGSPSARCAYPSVSRSPCTANSECTDLPNGFCSITPTHTRCYPTGRCETVGRTCAYRDEPCADDDDCRTLPGGVCEKRIGNVRCQYLNCAEDKDCGRGTRCACTPVNEPNACVPADCASDRDCPSGQACRLEIGCHGYASGYHCSTSLDTCRTKEDCLVGYCLFKGRWQCETPICPPVGP